MWMLFSECCEGFLRMSHFFEGCMDTIYVLYDFPVDDVCVV